MHKLNLKKFGVVWFKEKAYVNSIITGDTLKKRFFKIAVSKFLWLIKLTGLFKDDSDYIYGIIEELGIVKEYTNAVYVNLGRKPSRTYIWAKDTRKRDVFVKICDPSEHVNVPDEIGVQKLISKNVPNIQTFEIIKHGILRSGSTYLIYESLDIALLALRRQPSDKELTDKFQMLEYLHPDFNSENIFAIENKFYAVDFEVLK